MKLIQENSPLENSEFQAQPLTIESLRTFEGFENCSDEDAEVLIRTIDVLGRIVIRFAIEQMNKTSTQENLAA